MPRDQREASINHESLSNHSNHELSSSDQSRSKMATGSLLLLALISLSMHASAAESRFGKCCPPGQIFSVQTKVECVPAPSHAMEFYSVGYEGVPGLRNGFPVCEEVEDVTTMPLHEYNSTDFLQIPPCVEVLHTEATHENVSIVTYCPSNKDRAENREALNVSLPRFLDVRRCCPKNEVLDVHTKNCVPMLDVFPNEYNSSNVNEFLSLLPKNLDTVDLLNVTRGVSICPGALFTYEITADNIAFENGSLKVTLPTSSTKESVEKVTVTEENTCFELTTTRRLVARVCRDSKLCKNNSCVRKCCREDQSFGPGKFTELACTKFDTFDSSTAFYEKISNISNGAWKDMGSGLIIGVTCVNSKYRLESHEIGGFIPEEGTFLQIAGSTIRHSIEEHCSDVFYNGTEWEEILIPLICFPPVTENSKIKEIVSSVLQVISCVFLVLTLLVYICLPSLQNLHGKTLMCHAASLLLAYTCLAVITWVTPDSYPGDHSQTAFCAAMGYTMFFAFLSTFTWLNVMCFDIWRTFGRLRGHFSKPRSNLRRFLSYCLYAWGLAIFLTMIIILSDEMLVLPENLRPNFGVKRCWFSNDPSMFGELIFFRGPIAIQLISNVVFFILTSEHCSKVKAEISRVADPSDARSKRFHADKTKLVINIKLFVVMGLTWIAEIISSLLNQFTELEWQKKMFYVPDAINCLQGLLIFILFVLKPRVYEALRKRLGFGDQKKCSTQGTSTLQDPFKVKKSASNTTLTSSFAISSTP